ncbi:helix-turn-helix domain-containing protein [Amycolatopsis sp. cg5]|uniref:ATP-binding protein n=1 Tax=Amycolatopsis sp. cg5 TaxID=3238802 RepID=UPI0035261F91
MTNAAWSDDSSTFKALLYGYRMRAGLTQEELAEGSGVSIRAISDMERGVAKSPQRRTIEALAGSLALSDDELTALQRVAKQGRVRAVPQPEPAIYSPSPLGVLPPDLDDLTGREKDFKELGALVGELADGRRRAGRVAIVSGSAGTGKTSLAVRAAHEYAERFTDGRLFLKLRGMSAEPNDPADVLHLALRSLGVDAVRIPAEPEHRIGLCRALLKDRAMLIVLDDAADEAQVRPLLVGGPHCLTLITSRQLLVGLEGASRINLGALDSADAVALLSAIIGKARVSREHAAAIELAELCGRLPLALRIAGNRLASRPAWPLSRLVDQLRDQGKRLTTLTAGDLDIRSVFDLSYRQLSPNAATVFRRLSLVPAADFSAGAARALIDAPDEDEAALFLDELTDASMVQPSFPYGRYQFHDLLKVFATERLNQDDSPEDIAAAEARLNDWLVATATAAGRYFQPSGGVTVAPAPTPSFDDAAGAGRWLDMEMKNWSTAVRRAAEEGTHQAVLDLAEAMHWYSELGGTARTWHDVFGLAVRSALALGSKRDEAVHRNYLSWALTTLMGRADEAIEMAQLAREAAEAAGDLCEQGWARIYLLTARVNSHQPGASRALLDETVGLFDEAGDRLGLHIARAMRATHWHLNGEFDEAAAEYEACVSYFRQAHEGHQSPVDDSNYAYLLLRSSQNLTALDRLDTALAQCEEALVLFEQHHATLGQGRALLAAGRVLARQGDHPNARAKLIEALALFERFGVTSLQQDTLAELAALSKTDGEVRRTGS